MRARHFALACCAAGSLLSRPRAHDPGLSSLRVEVAAASVHAEMKLANADFAGTLGAAFDQDGDGSVSAAELGATPAPGADLGTWLEVDGQPLGAREAGLRLDGDGDVVLTFAVARGGATALALRVPALELLPRGHRQFATVTAGAHQLGEALLAAPAVRLRYVVEGAPAAIPARPAFAAYVRLGIEHVLTGYDHVLFLLALLVAVRSRARAVGIVTAFTAAHSLTLALAALGAMALPAVLVECAIAATVAAVGAENLLRREPRHRVGAAFGFGLIHGFGFAGCLQQLTVGTGRGMVPPLLGFNLGVELGQLLLLAAALPVWLLLPQRTGAAMRTLLSAAVLAIGLWWLMQRWP